MPIVNSIIYVRNEFPKKATAILSMLPNKSFKEIQNKKNNFVACNMRHATDIRFTVNGSPHIDQTSIAKNGRNVLNDQVYVSNVSNFSFMSIDQLINIPKNLHKYYGQIIITIMNGYQSTHSDLHCH